MMTAEKEVRIARDLRRLARAYCDGEFNKGEYRRRRRVLLLQCVDEVPQQPVPPETPEPAPAPQSGSSFAKTIVLPFFMGAAIVIGLCVAGYLLSRLL